MPKKTKAIKKTDIKANKPRLKKVKPSEYKIEKDEPNKTILIVCEGQSEELYFKSFPVISADIQAVGLGQSKIKLVQSTEAIQEKEKCDEVWCVFDMDIKYDEANCKADFDNAIKKAKTLGYNVAYSNDVFELWFYLHYQYTEQENHRTYYYKQLSKLWNINYEKHGKKYNFCLKTYQLLKNDPKASQEEAIKRAEKLFKKNSRLEYHKQNPVSLIYKPVRVLNENMRK